MARVGNVLRAQQQHLAPAWSPMLEIRALLKKHLRADKIKGLLDQALPKQQIIVALELL